jgi:uncharacterized protein involved in response to NO
LHERYTIDICFRCRGGGAASGEFERDAAAAREGRHGARARAAVALSSAGSAALLGAGIYAAFGVGAWLAIWLGDGRADLAHARLRHGHEMAFGFVAAAIAGFLSTAVPVWTGGEALAGRPLAALVALWCAGRAAFWAAGALPAWLIAAIDGAFLPALAIVLARTLRGSGQYRNYGIVAVVSLLALANAAMHAGALGLVSAEAAGRALRAGIDAVVVLLLVVGGRITPAFTSNALRRWGAADTVRSFAWLDGLAIGAALLLAAADLFAPRSAWSGVLAAIAGLAAAARLFGWRPWAVRADPLLWSLHAGMAWVAVGLLLVAAGDLGAPVPPTAGLHALTAGAMGTTILAVMTRVGLGHTGRSLVLPRRAVASYGSHTPRRCCESLRPSPRVTIRSRCSSLPAWRGPPRSHSSSFSTGRSSRGPAPTACPDERVRHPGALHRPPPPRRDPVGGEALRGRRGCGARGCALRRLTASPAASHPRRGGVAVSELRSSCGRARRRTGRDHARGAPRDRGAAAVARRLARGR